MSISQTNIPKATQVTITVDGTAFQDQTTAINPSGGEYGVNSSSMLNGDTFTQTGEKSPRVFEFVSTYTDGETSDLWPVLNGKHGDDVTIVYKPKGAGSGTTFTLTGLLYRLDIPGVSADANSMSYTWAVSGNVVVS
jgi:hypothetical protein